MGITPAYGASSEMIWALPYCRHLTANDISPFQAICGVSLAFHIWRNIDAYPVHISKEKCTKFEENPYQPLFVGYPDGIKDYKLCDLFDDRLFIDDRLWYIIRNVSSRNDTLAKNALQDFCNTTNLGPCSVFRPTISYSRATISYLKSNG